MLFIYVILLKSTMLFLAKMKIDSPLKSHFSLCDMQLKAYNKNGKTTSLGDNFVGTSALIHRIKMQRLLRRKRLGLSG
ncbi:hypothetical protein IM40_02200 [Candidatus Paracaedimonas acanthamoebae]|nr:hypothetical protein IM40_02200 [Candidatus Paracaedimonas acanthamoebae]